MTLAPAFAAPPPQVMACVMLLVGAGTGLVALVVTGAPLGYALFRGVEALQQARGGGRR